MYEPLEATDAFRLLVLEPGTRGEHVCCRIFNATHSTRLGYEALSYTWGSDDEFRVCCINDNTVPIRRNLWDALQHLRSPCEERVFWIDALCIDQSNVLERNHQVGLMHLIYSQAASVRIWLGKASPSSPVAMDWIDQSASRFRSSLGIPGRLTASTPQNISLDQHRRWASLRFLCERPYWCRVWIVQETVLADKIRLQCGKDEARWEGFANLINDFDRVLIPKEAREDAEFVKGSMAARIAELRRMYRLRGCQLEHLLIATRDSVCTDPRDRVYGLLGLTDDLVKRNIEIDYSGQNGQHDMMSILWKFFVRDRSPDLKLRGCQFLGIEFLQNRVRSEEMKWVISHTPTARTEYNAEEMKWPPPQIPATRMRYEILGKSVGKIIYAGQPWKGALDLQLWQDTLHKISEQFTKHTVVAQYEQFRAALSTAARDHDLIKFDIVKNKSRNKRKRKSAQPLMSHDQTNLHVQSKEIMSCENLDPKETGVRFTFWNNEGFDITFMEDLSVFVSSKGQMGIARLGIGMDDELCQFRDSDVTAVFRRQQKDVVAPISALVNSFQRTPKLVTEGVIIGKAVLAHRPGEHLADSTEAPRISRIPRYSVLDERLAARRQGTLLGMLQEDENIDAIVRFEVPGKRLRWLASWPRFLDSQQSGPLAAGYQSE